MPVVGVCDRCNLRTVVWSEFHHRRYVLCVACREAVRAEAMAEGARRAGRAA